MSDAAEQSLAADWVPGTSNKSNDRMRIRARQANRVSVANA